MTQFRVDAAAVATAAGATRASGAVIAAEVAAMMSHLTALEASWQGGAATQFAAVSQQWRLTQHQVEASLESIALALDGAARQYTETEQAATLMFTPR